MTYKKNIIRLFVCFLFNIIVLVGFGQNKTNILLNELDIAKTDSSKAQILNELSHEALINNQVNKAIDYAGQSLKYAITLENKSVEADNLGLIAKAMTQLNNIEEALKYYLRSADILEKQNDQKKLIQVYTSVAENYYKIKIYEKSSEYFIKAYEISKAKPVANNKDQLLENIGVLYFKSGEYTQSLKYFKELLELQQLTEHNDKILKALYNLSEVYKKLNQFNKSLACNLEIFSIYASEKDSLGMSLAMNNAGFNYVQLEEYKNAIDAFEKSFTIGEKAWISNEDKVKLKLNIGICYQNISDYDQSILNLREALIIEKSGDNFAEIARIENIIALTYYQMGDLYNARYFSQNSIKSAKQSSDKKILQECYKTYSQILKSGNDYITALDYYELHLGIRDSLLLEQRIKEQTIAQQRYALEKSEKELKLSLADEAMKDLALKKLKLETEKKQQELELEKSEKERILQSFELTQERHQNEIRVKEIKTLEQEKEIQDLQLEQKKAQEREQKKEIVLLNSEKKQQQLELEKKEEARKRATWMVILFIIIAILIFIGLLLTRKKNKILTEQKNEIEEKNTELEQMNEEIFAQKEYLQEANQEIQQQNKALEQKTEEILTQNEKIVLQKNLIEGKNKEITDSIYYAERIQSAVLPPKKLIKEFFTDHFIFFKPKDIVSGDFYWGASKDNKIIVTAADCTGHGVPGAFMSMLGTAFLNEIVTENFDLEAHEILNRLRNKMIKSLHQEGKEGEAKDGMDVALCVIDKNQMKLQFSGAHNPLYFVRNNKLEKIDADRMPIGIHYKIIAPFTLHEIEIQKGDIFYIFSDGFADQFGGPDKKKYLYKPFRDLLFNIHKLQMNEQHNILNKTFEDWKGNLEQIDDVLIIGMKI